MYNLRRSSCRLRSMCHTCLTWSTRWCLQKHDKDSFLNFTTLIQKGTTIIKQQKGEDVHTCITVDLGWWPWIPCSTVVKCFFEHVIVISLMFLKCDLSCCHLRLTINILLTSEEDVMLLSIEVSKQEWLLYIHLVYKSGDSNSLTSCLWRPWQHTTIVYYLSLVYWKIWTC